MGKCAMGFALPVRGPCPTCGAEANNTCGRWATAANEFINVIANLKRDGEDGFECDPEDAALTLDNLIKRARSINGGQP